MRVFIVTLCGVRVHRGVHVMVNSSKREFMIDSLQRKVQAFVKKCLLCRHVKGQLIVQRDWSATGFTTKRNKTLLMCYLYLGDSISGANIYWCLRMHFATSVRLLLLTPRVQGSQLTRLSTGTNALDYRLVS